MEGLYEQFAYKLRNINYDYKRYLFEIIDWSRKLLIIKGTRRVGKSTLALQYVKENFRIDNTILYVNADNIYFSGNSLLDLTKRFVNNGGKHLFIDEIHKYAGWEDEIEHVLTHFDKLQLVLIGSSVIDYDTNTVIKSLASEYELHGLSFREFVLFSTGKYFDKISLAQIMSNHAELSMKITKEIDPKMLLDAYMRYGYYPSFAESRINIVELIAETVNLILENDLAHGKKVDFSNVSRLKQLLYIIINEESENPNTSAIEKIVGSSRKTLVEYLQHMEKANLITLLRDKKSKDGSYSKPQQVFLSNTVLNNVMFFRENDVEFLIKTFFLSQIRVKHAVSVAHDCDFILDNKFKFNVVKDLNVNYTIKNLNNTFHAVYNTEIGLEHKIPLWMFGFMY